MRVPLEWQALPHAQAENAAIALMYSIVTRRALVLDFDTAPSAAMRELVHSPSLELDALKATSMSECALEDRTASHRNATHRNV